MARANLLFTLAFTAGISSISTSALAQAGQLMASFDLPAPGSAAESLITDGIVDLRVSVCNHADAGAAAIELGERIAATVFRRTAVAIDWTNACQFDVPTDLHMNLLPDRMTPRALRGVNMFGFAGSGQSVANVMWERIDAAAINHGILAGHLLGFVIAHELGHLLLPPNAHRWSNVMQRDFDFRAAAVHDLWFNREQAQLILRKVQSIADRRRDSVAIASN